jgi:hypothetical protein
MGVAVGGAGAYVVAIVGVAAVGGVGFVAGAGAGLVGLVGVGAGVVAVGAGVGVVAIFGAGLATVAPIVGATGSIAADTPPVSPLNVVVATAADMNDGPLARAETDGIVVAATAMPMTIVAAKRLRRRPTRRPDATVGA